MKDSYNRIQRVISKLSTESVTTPVPKPVIAERVAKEAKVSRATFYRYLRKHSDLQLSYDGINRPKSKSACIVEPRAQNLDEALVRIDILAKQLSAARKECDGVAKLKNAQIMLLWNECARLRELLKDLNGDYDGNVFPIS